MSLVACTVFSAKALTSSATTEKPRPASPALAASMAAFNAKRLVCSARLLIITVTPSTFEDADSSPDTLLLKSVKICPKCSRDPSASVITFPPSSAVAQACNVCWCASFVAPDISCTVRDICSTAVATDCACWPVCSLLLVSCPNICCSSPDISCTVLLPDIT